MARRLGQMPSTLLQGDNNQLPLLQGDTAHTNFFYFSFKGTHTNYLYYSLKGTHRAHTLFPLLCNGARTKLPLRLQSYLFSSCYCCCFSHYKFFCTTTIAYPPIFILRKHKCTFTNSKPYIKGEVKSFFYSTKRHFFCPKISKKCVNRDKSLFATK